VNDSSLKDSEHIHFTINPAKNMIKIHSQTDNEIISTTSDNSILEAFLNAEINHTCVCGGNAKCSTCRVNVIDGVDNCLPRNEKEVIMADRMGFNKYIRLACQTKLKGGITVRRLVLDDLDKEIIFKQLDDIPGTKIGHEKELAILFIDIENYTKFAETLPAYDVVHVLHRYYKTINQIVTKHNGLISDVAGDGVLSLFGVTKNGTNKVLDALSAVKDIQSALNIFNEYLDQVYGQKFGIRSGLNYGKAVVGSFDTGMMNKVAAIGDHVNLASRIESANKIFNTRVLISQSAKDQINDLIETYQMAPIELKGKTGKHVLYEVKI
jgi:adenylate cyclase